MSNDILRIGMSAEQANKNVMHNRLVFTVLHFKHNYDRAFLTDFNALQKELATKSKRVFT